MDNGEEFNKAPGSTSSSRSINGDPGKAYGSVQSHSKSNEYPMFLIPPMYPQPMLIPNFQPFFLPAPNPEFLRMMQMYTNGQQYERQLSKATSANVDFSNSYETSDVPLVPIRSVLHEQFIELTKIALKGCDLGERIAITHQKRPCFKKIDSLCARMKQDLMRPDGVLANINSQGIAWAVKDFVFAFTRIINAWVIIKGYASSNGNSESLSKVRNSLSPGFNDSFAKWQESTTEFVDEIIKSFMNLDLLVQSQKLATNGCKKASPQKSSSNSSDTLSETIDDPSYHMNFSDDEKPQDKPDDKVQEKSIYLKTGVYTTLQMPKVKSGKSQFSKPDLLESAIGKEELIESSCAPKLTLSNSMSRQISFLVHRISLMTSGEHFFSSQFIENYFPEFNSIVPDFIDLRSINLKTEIGDYQNIFEIVRDLRKIVVDSKKYLSVRPHKLLQNELKTFEMELESILAHDMFSSLDLTQVTGTDLIRKSN